MLELTLKRIDHSHPDRPAIDVAYHSAKDLLELIGDILDIARIESGRLSLSPERVNLAEIVASVVRVFDGLARQKNLRLLLEFSPANPAIDVLLDPMRFKQVLSNLVSNAIKFTRTGPSQDHASSCSRPTSPTGSSCSCGLKTAAQGSVNRINSGCSSLSLRPITPGSQPEAVRGWAW